MRKYNITKNLNAYGGRNNYSVPIGTTRNIKGSSNRIYQYCSRISETPLYCMFQIPPKPGPITPCSNSGYFSFSFNYTGPGTITEDIILQEIPVETIPGVFEITPSVTIVGNKVTIEIESCLYPSASSADFGITFNKQPGINTFNTNKNMKQFKFIPPLPIIFYNLFTNNLTFIAANNFPFSKTGNQFQGLININILNTFIPTFLPGTSLISCFKNCIDFNSNISNWNTSNVVNMSEMFNNASSFDQDISGWNTSNVLDMSYMFNDASSFNQPIDSWNTSNVLNMSYMFQNCSFFNQPICLSHIG
jgi:surface protein